MILKISIPYYLFIKYMPIFPLFKKRSPYLRRVAFTSHLKKNHVHSYAKMDSLKRRSFRKILSYKRIFIFIILLIIVIILFFSPFFKVQNIEVNRDNIGVDTSKIQVFLSSETLGKNIFLLNKSDILKFFEDKFEHIKDTTIEKELPNTIIANVRTYPVFASVKINIKKEEKDKLPEIVSQEYIINNIGNISYPNTDTKPFSKIIYMDTLEDFPVIGENIIPSDHIKKIQNISEKLLGNFDLAVKDVSYFKKGKEAHFNVFQFNLWFDLSQDIETQFNKFKKSLNSIEKSKVEYFDLRINNRIIYKEK